MANSSESGMSTYAPPFSRPRLPAVNDTCPPGLSPGLRVMMLMAPPIELRPYSVPCGPRSTSTRWIFEVPVLADLAAEVHAVHVHADTRVGRDQVILQADAADERIGRGCVAGREFRDI